MRTGTGRTANSADLAAPGLADRQRLSSPRSQPQGSSAWSALRAGWLDLDCLLLAAGLPGAGVRLVTGRSLDDQPAGSLDFGSVGTRPYARFSYRDHESRMSARSRTGLPRADGASGTARQRLSGVRRAGNPQRRHRAVSSGRVGRPSLASSGCHAAARSQQRHRRASAVAITTAGWRRCCSTARTGGIRGTAAARLERRSSLQLGGSGMWRGGEGADW
jgi:hypothetical protein